MYIHELAQQAGVPTKTIRYNESSRLLPRPRWAANNYRQYTPTDVERLRFIASGQSWVWGLTTLPQFWRAATTAWLPAGACWIPSWAVGRD